jgi:hypothetical protein
MRDSFPIAKKTMIQWVNGVPEPTYGNINPSSIKQLATTALSLPYEGDYNEELGINVIDPRFEGMSNAEVMWVRMAEKAAAGDIDAAKTILDRVLGKPKQSVETTTMTLTYPEFLEHLARQEEKAKNGNA